MGNIGGSYNQTKSMRGRFNNVFYTAISWYINVASAYVASANVASINAASANVAGINVANKNVARANVAE
jgi:hypothetical protein